MSTKHPDSTGRSTAELADEFWRLNEKLKMRIGYGKCIQVGTRIFAVPSSGSVSVQCFDLDRVES